VLEVIDAIPGQINTQGLKITAFVIITANG
jgi:hypothetical protein